MSREVVFINSKSIRASWISQFFHGAACKCYSAMGVIRLKWPLFLIRIYNALLSWQKHPSSCSIWCLYFYFCSEVHKLTKTDFIKHYFLHRLGSHPVLRCCSYKIIGQNVSGWSDFCTIHIASILKEILSICFQRLFRDSFFLVNNERKVPISFHSLLLL